MKKILGIDTGGTYTDAAVIDADTKELLFKSKTLTTKRKLRSCVETCVRSVPEELIADISMVCLSTTLATNAIVEDHGCKEGLILIGGKPQGKMPTDRFAVVQGRYDIKGRAKENLDTAEVARTVESFRGKVDAIAVSGYASVRNPAHEIYVKKVIEQTLEIPVACAHELTSSLGFYDRTVTVDLNARLIPLVRDLMDAVRLSMELRGIKAPLMIVKSDGSLMTDAMARSKPIETILSGPAASVIGGIFLSGQQDAFVMDIGGTTTDIANVSDGHLNIRDEGAKVGGWYTRARAVEVFTSGLGGDSRIYVDSHKKIRIDTCKSIPLCMAGERSPELIREIGDIYVNNAYRHFCYQDEEAYQLVQKFSNMTYTNDEEVVIEILRFSPHTLYYLEENLHLKNIRQILAELLRCGVIARISLTPTDILHFTGEYREWDPIISEMGVNIAADQCHMTADELVGEIREKMSRRLNSSCIQAAMYFDHQQFEDSDSDAISYFLNDLYFDKKSSILKAEYHLEKPIVAIGAPAAAWADGLSGKMDTGVIVPDNAEVANAIGAAVGKAVESVEVLIRPDSVSGKYIVYSPLERFCEDTLEEATLKASDIGGRCIARLSENREFKLSVHSNDVEIEDSSDGRKVFVERVVEVMAEFL